MVRGRNNLTCLLPLGVLLCVMTASTPAQFGATPPSPLRRVSFERGSTSAIIESAAVVRGTRDRYILAARRGQRMSVRLSSLESNAVFDLHVPGGKARLNTMNDTTIWAGRLPVSGDYQITVGPTRGNATYTLEVSIEN